MAKTTKIVKSSFQLGWIDGLERKEGRSLTTEGIDSAAYRRGIARAAEFRRRISAQKPNARQEGKDAHRAKVPAHHNPYAGYKEHEQLAIEWAQGWDDGGRADRPSARCGRPSDRQG